MTLPKTILVPTDFGEASEAALDHALSLAAKIGAEVIVMHAFEIPMVGFPEGPVVATAELTSRIIDGAQAGLDEAVRAHSGSGVQIRAMLKQGEAWSTVLDVAAELGVGLIVMGTHGRHGLPRALIGSVAEKVVRMAPVPVLTVHAERAANGAAKRSVDQPAASR